LHHFGGNRYSTSVLVNMAITYQLKTLKIDLILEKAVMTSTAATVDEYIEQLPADRKDAIKKLRETVLKNIPKGFEEVMAYGMPGYVVPHFIYPAGYHCNPKQPLPFVNIASQKNFISFYQC
jgi:hypothetical protein